MATPYDRLAEVKEFDKSRMGVKGLVDSGVAKIPRFFIHPPENRPKKSNRQFQLPTIDLQGLGSDYGQRKIIEEILRSSETWGFFHVVNHGIPTSILDQIIEDVRRFHEQPKELKMDFYSRDPKRAVKFYTNYDLFASRAANWRDSVSCAFDDDQTTKQLPPVLREIMTAYSEHMTRLGNTLFKLLSEALSLEPNHLINIGCTEAHSIIGNYYPVCPEPELTFGTTRHSDPDFLTILLQDHIGGLQVLHQHEWIDVPPTPGALVTNIGDLMQLISNDKLKSVQHRVLANKVHPRISVACFFAKYSCASRLYGPIEELLSDANPPLYRETSIADFAKHYVSKGIEERSLDYLKL